MKTVLLTGAEGMIGSHLKVFLRDKGFAIVEFEGDVCSYNDWNKYHSADYLIHLAAFAGVRASITEPELFYNNNVDGMDCAINFAKRSKCAFLYASSSNAKEWWTNPYATTKKMNELQARVLNTSVGMRFHTVWPGRDDMLYKLLAAGNVKYINGDHYRDFIHIDDLCTAILTIMENYSNMSKVVDIGTGHATPVLEVAKRFGFDGEVRFDSAPHERTITKADIEYLLRLGWTPTRNILV
jgi:nucleoside-diphosphate-sugar epimerase